MDSLENKNDATRLRRAMILSFFAYFAWLIWFAPKQVPNQNIVQNTADQNPIVNQDKTVKNSAAPSIEESLSTNNPSVSTAPSIAFHEKDFTDEQIPTHDH